LVQEDGIGTGEHCHQDLQPPQLSTRKIASEALQQLFALPLLDQKIHLLIPAPLISEKYDFQVLPDSQSWKNLMARIHEPSPVQSVQMMDRDGAAGGRRRTLELDGRFTAGQEAEKRGLPDPIPTDDRQEPSRPELEVDRLEKPAFPCAILNLAAQTFDRDDRR
ncbi:MAG TPA: hypothetical protein VF179_16990, partial [Thermoanaerobaculia bacterium]|nr:hypothetical protein [Thermoanaerobaculia bacterium]